MKKTLIALVLALVLVGLNIPRTNDVEAKGSGGLIQIAILLDTSGSMEGLIEQAKSQLWRIVNELALSRKNGKSPRLEVALYEYGKSSIPADLGYIRMLSPLSTDLDNISEELFKLHINGGDEYCGMVILRSVQDLQWSKRRDVYKAIFIAGNEPFTQGPTNFRIACNQAAAAGIIVNTIHCGDYSVGVRTHWKEGADLAGGSYMNIDHDHKIPDIIAPQDDDIMRLNKELNDTYIPYGYHGETKKELQAVQDKNASTISNDSKVNRAVSKASSLYTNSIWDLIDAIEAHGYELLEQLKEEELPQEMREMNLEEKKEYVNSKAKQRQKIKERIQQLNEERKAYVTEEMKKSSLTNTLDQAMIQAIRDQAQKKGFVFSK